MRVLFDTVPVTCTVEGAHQRLRVHAGVWIRRHQAATRTHTAVHVTGCLVPLRKRKQCAHIRMRQLASVLVEPVREVRGIVEVETIQQRTGVETRDTLDVICRHRGA